MINKFNSAFAFLFLFCCFELFSQGNFTLKIILIDVENPDSTLLKKSFDKTKNFKDTLQVQKELQSILNDLIASGYLSASIDTLIRENSIFTANVYAGSKYTWAILRRGNVPDELLDGTGFRKKLYAGKPFRYEQAALLNKRILNNCENKGYPFASVSLDSIEIIDNKFSASLSVNKNRLIAIDSVIIKGSASVAPVYIYNYTGIFPGDIYNETQIRRVSSRLRELPFVREAKQSQVLFTEKETKLFLFLENKKASQFDGVIGILPDENKTGKINLTGEVHLKLQNSLNRGEVIELDWKQLPVKTQDLKVHALYPFLFNTPFGIDGNLAIYKKDSTYIDVTKNLGIQYSFTGNNYLKAFVNDKESDLQSTAGLENITTLPPYADITTVSYGATIHYERLDYRLNPRTGIMFEATGSTGNRKIRKNSEINPALYDSLRLNSVTYQGELKLDYFFPLGGRHVIDLGDHFGYIYNPVLFTNELYRIGGLKSLRGFDEESIYASIFTFVKLEYRYQLEQNSFLFLFYNQAWYENKSRNFYSSDKPLGFGAGINFETKIGIMSVSYALGKQFDNPIYFKNAKVHFGIVNYF